MDNNQNFDLWSGGQEKSLITRRGNNFIVTLTGNSETTLSLQTSCLFLFIWQSYSRLSISGMSNRQEQYIKTVCQTKKLFVMVIQRRKIIQCERCELKAMFDAFHTCQIWELTALLTYKDNDIHNTKQLTRELYCAIIHLKEINLRKMKGQRQRMDHQYCKNSHLRTYIKLAQKGSYIYGVF